MQNPDPVRVFQAFKNAFSGVPYTELETSEAIKLRIKLHSSEEGARTLLEQYHIESICSVIQSLISKRLFNSKKKAKAFLLLSIHNTVSKHVKDQKDMQNTAGSPSSKERNAVQDEAQQELSDPATLSPTISESVLSDSCPSILSSADKHTTSCFLPADTIITRSSGNPGLLPIMLSTPLQVRLLKRLQSILEHSFYSFATNNFPNVLVEKQWPWPESGELNAWPSIFRARKKMFSTAHIFRLRKPFDEILQSFIQTRNAAVHRHVMSADSTIEFFLNAESFLEMLQDKTAQTAVANLRQKADKAVQDISENRTVLISRLRENLEECRVQRAIIAQREVEAIDQLLKADRVYCENAGVALNNTLRQRSAESLPVPGDSDEEDDSYEPS